MIVSYFVDVCCSCIKIIKGRLQKKKVKLGLLAEVGGAGGLRGVQGPNHVIRYSLIA